MKVDISEIAKTDGASLDVEFEERLESLETENSDVKFNSPVKLKVRLTNVSGVINLMGRLKTEYEVDCYRCLKSVRRDLEIRLNEEFVNTQEDDDGAVYVYKNNLIDLDKVVVDNILLSLPVRQLCSEVCKGYCPSCGANLNQTSCNCCEEEKINPQMAKLKDFFKQ